ncbi:MAG: hypothetical protein QOF14_4275 [Hyphomicrobiales bacterium]|nr:hypothetical protein [Hyphomicrobiales bacterium]
MPLQNRVTPFGELIATPARGTIYGNRGGKFHRDDQTLGKRRWASRQWICCVLSFKGRHHPVWRDRYTALFFLDEVTALAAGHRPCFECRRADAKAFAEKWAEAKGIRVPRAPDMDLVLQSERLNGREKRTHEIRIDDLPDGAVVALDGAAFAARGSHLLRWSENGYSERIPRSRGVANVLTPPSIVGVLAAGYQPQWHSSADA